MNMMLDSLTVSFATLGSEQYLRLSPDRWYYFKSPDSDLVKLGYFLSSQLENMYRNKTESGYQE